MRFILSRSHCRLTKSRRSSASHRLCRSPRAEALEARQMLSANVLTYHNDLVSSGTNLAETTLTPSNVNQQTFGKVGAVPVDGNVYAQPLYMENVNITTGAAAGTHNVVFVATEHDSVYAIDSQSGAVLWHDSFLDPANGVTSVPYQDTNSDDITPELGITATPVIDSASGTIYVVANTKEVRGDGTHYVYRLHALDISSGAEQLGGPLLIGDTIFDGANYTYVAGPTVNGTGAGSVNGQVTFNALRELDRSAITLSGGDLYLAFGSHSDQGPSHGWILGVDAHTLDLWAAVNLTPNGTLGDVWMSGNGITNDQNGNYYVATGNGTFDTTLDANGFPSQGDYGDSIVSLSYDGTSSPSNQNINGWGLKVVQYFTPANQNVLDDQNLDLGSGGIQLLPDAAGSAAHPHLMIEGGKQGTLYLIDRDNMRAYQPTGDQIVQEPTGLVRSVFDTPAYFNGTLYYAGVGDQAKALSISDGQLGGISSQSSDTFGFPGATPSISANGTTNGIVWLVDRGTNELRAYDANNLANELYTSDQAVDGRDQLGRASKFSVPTIADGHVFVGTANGLSIYGLLDANSPAPIVGAPLSVSGNAFQSLAHLTVATFTHGDGSLAAGSFLATIDWGDGQISTGTVSAAGGVYSISGAHTYLAGRDYKLTVSVFGDRASAFWTTTADIGGELLPDGTPGTPLERYIAATYRDVLGRGVDAASLATWEAALTAGLRRSVFASALTHSDEYYHIVIQAAYQHYLGRAADAPGLASWTGAMRAGLSDEMLEAGFIGSPEFYQHAGGTDRAWVDAMYLDLLDRPADLAGENSWVAALAVGVSRTAVAFGFAASPEREKLRVQDDYFQYLGRTASDAELSGWVLNFESGVSNESVIAGFVGSDEYYQAKQ
jgi:hypothetical protein